MAWLGIFYHTIKIHSYNSIKSKRKKSCYLTLKKTNLKQNVDFTELFQVLNIQLQKRESINTQRREKTCIKKMGDRYNQGGWTTCALNEAGKTRSCFVLMSYCGMARRRNSRRWLGVLDASPLPLQADGTPCNTPDSSDKKKQKRNKNETKKKQKRKERKTHN